MNQKLVFVSIIAVVAAFGASAIAIGLGDNMAFAANNKCTNGAGIGVVQANVLCNVKVCANAQVLNQGPAKCNNS